MPTISEDVPMQEGRQTVSGFAAVKSLILSNKYDALLWILRVFVVVSSLLFVLPILGVQFAYLSYKRVLLASAAISALRLHQRLPRFQFTGEFLRLLVQEDSFHYLIYNVLFLTAQPSTMILVPVTFFAVLHAASYSRRLLEVSGSAHPFIIRLKALVSKVEARDSQQAMLQFIASSEIMLMGGTILMLLSGQGSILLPFFYYRFLQLRYASRRNPYSRMMFSHMRQGIDRLSVHPKCPAVVGRMLNSFVGVVCRLAPGVSTASPAS